MLGNWLEKAFSWAEGYGWAIPIFVLGVATGLVVAAVDNVGAAGNSLITSIVGTLIGALFAFLLTLRAQRSRLKAEIENTALLEVTAAINQYLRWSASLRVFATGLRSVIRGNDLSIDWRETFKEFEKARIEDPSAWLLRLEEYGNVFPYAREGRRELARHYRNVAKALTRFGDRLLSLSVTYPPDKSVTDMYPDFDEFRFINVYPEFLEEIDDFLSFTHKQHHLMIDLLFALQNRSLGKLFGNIEPPPERPGRTGPYLVTKRDGTFRVVD